MRQCIGHPRVIMIDRAYYHPGYSKWKGMDWISIGWLRPDGSRFIRIGEGREKPEIHDRPEKGGTIFLADYNGVVEKADTVRLHPEQQKSNESLHDALRRHRTAIGYGTSALITAAIEGLEIVCKDPTNIINEPNWREILPYADWHYSEIQSGELWEHLKHDLHTGYSSDNKAD